MNDEELIAQLKLANDALKAAYQLIPKREQAGNDVVMRHIRYASAHADYALIQLELALERLYRERDDPPSIS